MKNLQIYHIENEEIIALAVARLISWVYSPSVVSHFANASDAASHLRDV